MPRLIIKNFGPLQDIDLELKDFMVFIGPQASGKSTIARVVYFFRNVHSILSGSLEQEKYKRARDKFIINLSNRFKEEFGHLLLGRKFDILVQFWYSKTAYITFSWSIADEDLKVEISEELDFEGIHEKYHDKSDLEVEYQKTLNEVVRDRYSKAVKDFNASLFSFTQRNYNAKLVIEENRIGMLSRNTPFAEAYSSTFNTWKILYSPTNPYVKAFGRLIPLLLKGKTHIDGSIPKITPNANLDVSIPIQYWSSGQQSAFPILHYLYFITDITVSEGDKSAFLVIEEPETNLYPTAQKNMAYAMATAFNSGAHQFIITTHSPYILTSLNNLLAAYKTGNLANGHYAEEVKKLIPEVSWLNPEKVGAYYVGGEENEGKIVSILDDRTGLIDAAPIDDASSEIGEEFDELMGIVRKNANAARHEG